MQFKLVSWYRTIQIFSSLFSSIQAAVPSNIKKDKKIWILGMSAIRSVVFSASKGYDAEVWDDSALIQRAWKSSR